MAGRGVAGGRLGDDPAHRGIGKGSAGVVGDHNRRGRLPEDYVRSRALFGLHLEFRPAELLDLEPVSVLSRAAAGDAEKGEGDIGVAEIDLERQAEREMEAAKLAEFQFTLGELVAARAANLVGEPAQTFRQRLQVSANGVDDPADPALDPDLFAGAVHAAVIEDMPGVGVRLRPCLPVALSAPPGGAFRQEGEFGALLRGDHA